MLTPVNFSSKGRRPLDAALAVLRRDGPAALSMRNVADEAGVTATALYRHFANKEDLLREVIREVFGILKARLFEVGRLDDPMERLRRSGEVFLDHAMERPNEYELLFVTPHGVSIDRYPDDFRAGRSTTFRLLTLTVKECMDSGRLRADEPSDVALSIYAHMHGLIMLHRAGRFQNDPSVFRPFYQKSMEHLLAGLR